ncbi:hypothetical protein GOP47_0005749 [Adiantum capillus-veneris]|uniref:CCHC-type domain-containing protein n=1 Tax=Adiantum capillus-veneris TaxID=13818 RepID=A0A9D4V6B7_ADICA|nr:hypothetical protein GOP47_0005749 [Adiantum capillus-veneris]
MPPSFACKLPCPGFLHFHRSTIFSSTNMPANTHGNTRTQHGHNKRKFIVANFEAAKRPKGSRGPLSPEEFEKDKKEKLCFQCLGNGHGKKDCPKGKSVAYSKEKAVHMVQLLPLESSSRFSMVDVTHSEVVHECCITASMWQQTFGPHELVHMHGSLQGHNVRILVDDGATHFSLTMD